MTWAHHKSEDLRDLWKIILFYISHVMMIKRITLAMDVECMYFCKGSSGDFIVIKYQTFMCWLDFCFIVFYRFISRVEEILHEWKLVGCCSKPPAPKVGLFAFKQALLFPTILTYSYFSLLFLKKALLSLLFHSKMSFTHKNP